MEVSFKASRTLEASKKGGWGPEGPGGLRPRIVVNEPWIIGKFMELS